MKPRGLLEGWRLFGLVSFGVSGMVVALLLAAGTGEGGLRMIVRATARTSVTLFLLAFAASSLRRFRRSPLTAWLLRNRRYLGVSFALSHFLHLIGIVALAVRFPHPFYEESVSVVAIGGGGLAYVFIAAMAATSFDRTAAWLGQRRWKILHTVGGYYIWAVFAQSYVLRAFEFPFYGPMALAVLGALGLRVAARLRLPCAAL